MRVIVPGKAFSLGSNFPLETKRRRIGKLSVGVRSFGAKYMQIRLYRVGFYESFDHWRHKKNSKQGGQHLSEFSKKYTNKSFDDFHHYLKIIMERGDDLLPHDNKMPNVIKKLNFTHNMDNIRHPVN